MESNSKVESNLNIDYTLYETNININTDSDSNDSYLQPTQNTFTT